MAVLKTNHDVIKDKVRFVHFYFVSDECIGEFLSEFLGSVPASICDFVRVYVRVFVDDQFWRERAAFQSVGVRAVDWQQR